MALAPPRPTLAPAMFPSPSGTSWVSSCPSSTSPSGLVSEAPGGRSSASGDDDISSSGGVTSSEAHKALCQKISGFCDDDHDISIGS